MRDLFTRSRVNRSRSSGEERKEEGLVLLPCLSTTAQTDLRWRSEGPEGDGVSEANAHIRATKDQNSSRIRMPPPKRGQAS